MWCFSELGRSAQQGRPVTLVFELGRRTASGSAAALALPAMAPALASLRASPPGALMLGLVATKEMLAGVLVELLFSLPIWAAQSAGEVVDMQRGASSSGTGDPGAAAQMSATAGLLATTPTAVFVMAGGLGFLAAALYGSYGLWPLLRLAPHLSPGTPGILLGALGAAPGDVRSRGHAAQPGVHGHNGALSRVPDGLHD